MVIFALFALTTFLSAKTYTAVGTYVQSRCGDLCYMIFNTDKGQLTLYGYVQDFKGVYKGRSYKIKYKKNMKIQVAELGTVQVDGIVSIVPTKRKSSKSKHTGKSLAYLDRECKSSGAPYCYTAKRYRLFQQECRKGDRISCKHIKELDTAIRDHDLQGINYISNTATTGKGR